MGFFSAVWNSVIEYETPRLVKIHNRKVGLVRRLIQLGIILYVAIYALWLQKGYQEFGRVESSVTTKIKGVTKSHLGPNSSFDPDIYTRIWDVADYVIPPAENGAFFVATNVIITANQTRAMCPEDHTDVKGVSCTPDYSDCDEVATTTTADATTTTASTSSATATSTTTTSATSSAPAIRSKRAEAAAAAEEAVAASAAAAAATASPSDSTTTSYSSSTASMDSSSASAPTTASPAGAATSPSPSSPSSDKVPYPPSLRCRALDGGCPAGDVIFKAHGPLTGNCVPSDRPNVGPDEFSCEVESWCPIEVDSLPLGKKRALMARAEDYTVFVKNSVAFPYFGDSYVRNNLISHGGRPCLFVKKDKTTGEDLIDDGCQIFRLGDMVRLAGGDFSKMAIKGGVVSLSIAWHCNLDYDFMSTCLPAYNFRILDDFGWNFRHAKYHEENRRTLYKMYGIKFIITIEGRGGKFNLKNTILNIGSGLALLGVTTVVCDFLLMYIKERRMIKQKKYDYVEVIKPPKLTAEADEEVDSNVATNHSNSGNNNSGGGGGRGGGTNGASSATNSSSRSSRPKRLFKLGLNSRNGSRNGKNGSSSTSSAMKRDNSSMQPMLLSRDVSNLSSAVGDEDGDGLGKVNMARDVTAMSSLAAAAAGGSDGEDFGGPNRVLLGASEQIELR